MSKSFVASKVHTVAQPTESFWSWAKALVAPSYLCMSCMASHDSVQLLCSDCSKALPWIVCACQRCALPLAMDASACGQCLTFLPEYLQTQALFEYKAPISRMVQEFKYQKKLHFGRFFSDMLAEKMRIPEQAEVIIPIPSLQSKWRERGFNPAIELSFGLAKKYRLPVLSTAVRCRPGKRSQAGLSRSARLAQAESMFQLVKSLPYKHVVIVDDVLTTGSTLRALALALAQHGVRSITACVVARALS